MTEDKGEWGWGSVSDVISHLEFQTISVGTVNIDHSVSISLFAPSFYYVAGAIHIPMPMISGTLPKIVFPKWQRFAYRDVASRAHPFAQDTGLYSQHGTVFG